MSGKADFLQIRDFGDGTYSVMVRVWTPHKKFYEHPTLKNLTRDMAQKHCEELIKKPPKVKEVLDTWLYIGD